MQARDPSVGEEPVPAPRARRTLAGLIDTATLGLLYAFYLRGILRGGQDAGPNPDAVRLQRRLRLLPPALGILSEQLGTPGGWIAGLRIVDRRTGRRVALWRTLAVVLLKAVTEAARRRLTPSPAPIPDSEHEDFARELQRISERYPDDGERPAEATSRFYAQHRVEVNPWRWLPAIVGAALIDNRLRRRLAPTAVVLARQRVGHNP
jgi:hypothetical protein